MLNVVLLFGGKSVEHDVSIITYFQVLSAIDQKKYNVYPVYLSKENQFLISKNKKKIKDLKTFQEDDFKGFKETNFLKKKNKVYIAGVEVDIVFNLTHGKDLEDGSLSGFFKILGVSYTNPSVSGSTIFHNKYLTKVMLEKEDIKAVEYVYINEASWSAKRPDLISKIEKFPTKIVKPCSLGSSIGIRISKDINATIDDINEAFKYDKELIIERCLDKYLELNQAIYRCKGELILSKIEEVKNNSSMYTFESKYENGNLTRVIPAKINNTIRNKIAKTTKKIGYILNSKGVIRIDYLFDLDEEKLYVNEVNVIPGAIGYYLFEARGIYFSKLIDDLISEAIHDKILDDNRIACFKSNILSKKSNKK